MTVKEIRHNFKIVKEKVKATAMRIGRSVDDIKIIAVSKTHPVEYLDNGIEAGIDTFGENYAQETKEKFQSFIERNLKIPEIHFIGHLQRNKVKYIAQNISMIHSVDSVRLAEEINKQAKKHERVIPILAQINTSGELSKSGCKPEEADDLILGIKDFENVKLKGLMTIGSFSDDENIYRAEFQLLRKIRDDISDRYSDIDLHHLSMGMTHDFEAAIEEGATMVRVGTAIFGYRNYNN